MPNEAFFKKTTRDGEEFLILILSDYWIAGLKHRHQRGTIGKNA